MNRKSVKRQRELWKEQRANGVTILCGICNEAITSGKATNRGGLSVDHIIPLAKGGQNVIENMQPAHSKCNTVKGDNLDWDREAIIRKVDNMIANAKKSQIKVKQLLVEEISTMDYPGYKVTLHKCGDCAVLPGYPHSEGCDVARCPICGTQRLQCYDHEESRRPSIWTGVWPGELECAEYGLWAKFVYADDGKLVDYIKNMDEHRPAKWVTTTADDPDGSADLNTLAVMGAKGELIWSVRLQRYIKKELGGLV